MRLSDDGELDDAGGEGGRRDRELLTRAIRMLAVAVHRRFKALGRRNPSDPNSPMIDQLSVAEWEALMKDEWANRRRDGD